MKESMKSEENQNNNFYLIDLKQKAISGFFWSFFERGGDYIISFIFGLIMVRLILPHDYGIYGMTTIFFSISMVMIDSSFSSALIQKKNADETDYSTVFFINFSISVILAGIIFFSAPYIANFYKVDELKRIIRIMSLLLPLNSLYIVQYTKLTKSMNFRFLSKLTITKSLFTGLAGIYFAYSGYGVYSLIYPGFLGHIILILGFLYFQRWIPKFTFSISSIKSLIGYSSKLFGVSLLSFVLREVYNSIIGKLYKAEILGYYTRSRQTQELLTSTLQSVMYKVGFPVFSHLQDDDTTLKSGLRKMIMIVSFINFNIIAILFVLAQAIFILLFTEKWLASVIYFRILLIAAIFIPIQYVFSLVFLAKKLINLHIKLELLYKIVLVTAIIITIYMPLDVLIASQAVVSFITFFISSYFINKIFGYTFSEQFSDLFPNFVLSAFLSCSLYFIQFFTNTMLPIFNVLISFSAFLIILIIIGKFFKMNSYFEIMEILKTYFKNSKILKAIS
jgi:O-antigen/teichoic acid export membrane protein